MSDKWRFSYNEIRKCDYITDMNDGVEKYNFSISHFQRRKQQIY